MAHERKKRSAKSGTFMGIIDNIRVANQFKAAIEGDWPLQDGDKVQLNLDVIKGHPDYQKRLPAYQKFCEENAGKTFTVAYDKRLRQSLVSLVEDTTEPKWLFWIGDLNKIS